MKLAAAQTIPKDGNIDANISDHIKFAEQAADEGVQLIVFPEMSLTGYMRDEARVHSFVVDDIRLNKLKVVSDNRNIILVVGAPVWVKTSLYIGAFIIYPNSKTELYTKQFLHDGEEQYFTPSNKYNPIITIKEDKLSCAICADVTKGSHPANAKHRGATVYLASLFYTPSGIEEGCEQLSSYALQHKMHILMANFGGMSNNLESGGRSGYWDSNGEMIAQLDRTGEALLIVTK